LKEMRGLIFIMFWGIVWPALGQDHNLYNIKLKDGTSLRAVYLDLDSADLLKGQKKGGLVLSFLVTDISSMSLVPEFRPPSKKFYHVLEAGVLIGNDFRDETLANQTLQTVNGYRIFDFLQTGIGVGVDWYDNFIVMPLFLDITAELTKTRVVPFYSGQVGYGFGWKRKNADLSNVSSIKGGFTYRVEAGIAVAINEFSLLFSLGYRQQKTETTFGDLKRDGFDQVQDRKLNRFTITTGIQF